MLAALRFNVAKCETQCRLCLGRIKLQKNKRTLQMKQYRKEIAELLRTGKQEYARIRVESVIREKYLLHAYEILELYLELLTVRIQMVAKTKEIPRDMIEAVSSIIYAAERVPDMPELRELRAIFASKYGKEYAAEASADATAPKWQVNTNLIRFLLVEAPQPEDKLAELSEIAQEFGVEWDVSAAYRDMLPPAAPHGAAAIGGPGPMMQHGMMPPQPSGAMPPAQHQAMPPGAPHMLYNTASQAAAAAAASAAQAQAAAHYAAQLASEMGDPAYQQVARGGPPGGPPPGWLVPPSSGPSSGAPSAGPHHAMPPGAPPPGVPYPYQQAPPPAPPPSAAPSAGSNGSHGFVVRSEEELQRAYDAALGPPTKGEVLPPSAPVATSSLDQLPAPPHHNEHSGAGTAPVPPEVEDEYEELTKRLEALKKS